MNLMNSKKNGHFVGYSPFLEWTNDSTAHNRIANKNSERIFPYSLQILLTNVISKLLTNQFIVKFSSVLRVHHLLFVCY